MNGSVATMQTSPDLVGGTRAAADDTAGTESSACAFSNASIAGKLRTCASMLEQQGADGYRIKAYRRAAETIADLQQPVADLLAHTGIPGLVALPTIGKGIASAIAEMVVTGHWTQLDRLRGELSPDRLFQTIPGIGPKLAKSLADDAHLETLEDLEDALNHQGTHLRGLGPGRRAAITAMLAERLRRPPLPHGSARAKNPPVSLLLQVDAMYRERAAAGKLRTIAPKRFNPSGRSWLPIMHASHDKWHFTVLFSNTARAHQLAETMR